MAMGLLEVFLLLSSVIVKVFACKGYEVRDVKASICDGKDQVLDFENFSAELTDDCKVVPSGAIVIKKQVDGGNGTYLVEKKGGVPMKFGGKKELCELLRKSKESPDIDMVFKMLQLEQDCPIKAGKITGDKNGVSISKFKDQLKMAEGNFVGKIKGQTLDGDDVCIDIALSIGKKGGGGGGPSIPHMG